MAETGVAVKWRYRAEYLEFCNCAYGCPCNFSGFPTTGACEAVVGYRMLEGTCGDVDLTGATLVLAVKWPKAIHDGNGDLAVFFDTSTTQEQIDALVAIFTGQHGGLPHEIIAATISNMRGPFVEDITFNADSTKSSITIGNKVHAEMTPFVAPVEPHDPQEIHIGLPQGFIWQDALAARNVGQKVSVDGLTFHAEDTNAFYTVLEHQN